MSAALIPYAFPSVTRVVIAWLLPLCGPGGVGARRPDAAVLPYRLVTTVAGHETPEKVKQCATVSVHTFGDSYDSAEQAAQITHQRMLLMGPPTYGPQQITITNGDGSTQTVVPDCVTTSQIPVWHDYEDELIYRFVARYDIDMRVVANP